MNRHWPGYVVVGVDAFYTSKKCAGCGLFVAQVDMRRFYCSYCHVYHHRDVIAAENMAKIVQGHLRRRGLSTFNLWPKMYRFLGKRSVELDQAQSRAVLEPALAPPPPTRPQGAARGPQLTQVRISNGMESRPGHRL